MDNPVPTDAVVPLPLVKTAMSPVVGIPPPVQEPIVSRAVVLFAFVKSAACDKVDRARNNKD